MIPVEKFARSKGLNVEETIEKIRDGAYQGRLVHGEWYIYDDQINKNPRSQSNQSQYKEESEYTVARVLQKLFIVLGWLLIIIGVLAAIAGMSDTCSNKLAAAIPGLAICFAGIITIAAAQITLAVIDTADNSRRILEELRSKN